jgi:dolichol-phosphate mannosyltransferase
MAVEIRHAAPLAELPPEKAQRDGKHHSRFKQRFPDGHLVLFLLDSRSRQFDSIGLVFFAGLTTRLALPLRFAAFVLVGGFCLTANTLLLWALTEGLGTHYLVSTVIAFAAITPLGFLLNKVITFRTRREYARIELPRYFVAMAASFAANLALMYLLVSALGVWYLAASLVVAVILVVLNFLTSDRWSFRV